MADTIKQIEDRMLADKESRPALEALDSTSNVSIWRNLIYSFAVASHENQIAQDVFKLEVEQRAKEIPTGTARWYAAESLNFQFGDSLVFEDGNITYSEIDEEKQIISLASADKENGYLVIKVAKLDVAGNAIPLDSAELSAFKEYWSLKKFACTPLAFISQEADVAKIYYRVGVDSTIINPANGESLQNSGVFPVEDAINTFLKEFQGDNFSSVLKVMKLTDAIQSVTGVNNAIATSVQIKPFDGIFTEVVGTQKEEYTAQAGYIRVSETLTERLRDTINYYNG